MKTRKRKQNLLFFFITLLTLWLSLAGSFQWQFLVAGVSATVFVLFLTYHLLFESHELPQQGLNQMLKWIKLILKLAIEIVLANISFAKIVLTRKLSIQPLIFKHKTQLQTNVLRVLYANSITLTPGTLTIDMVGDELTIHALTTEAMEGIESRRLEAPFVALEKKQ